jgi:chorismate lyase/3-hydroxybenzoate synthase
MLWPEYHPLQSIPADRLLAVVTFGGGVKTGALTINVPVPQCGDPLAEVWRTSGEVRRGRHGNVEFAAADEVMFGSAAGAGGNTHDVALRVYHDIVDAARAAGYPHLLRIWNHLGGINEPEEGIERYKRFSAGRHDALISRGYDRQTFPAASAVGASTPGLVTYFVAGRVAGKHVENPRQVPAYDYPPEHGPKSPTFARGTIGAWNGHSVFFVSGTASVVGHETRHAGDIEAQIEETLLNLDYIIGQGCRVGATPVRTKGRPSPPLAVAKVYIRRAADRDVVVSRLREALPDTRLLFLMSDICRRDLLLEVDGLVRL